MIGLGLGISTATARAWTPKALGGGLALWLRADKGITYGVGAKVAGWADQSGHGRNFAQAIAGRQPVQTDAYVGARQAVVFDGSDDILTAASGTFSGLAATGSAEVFIVCKTAADPPVVGFGGCWQLGSPAASTDHLPYTDGNTYCGIFSTARKTVGALGAGHYASPRVVQVYSAAADWRYSTNGVQRYSTATNTFGVGTTTAVGGDPDETAIRMAGGVAEVIVCAPVLSAVSRARVLHYLGWRYGIAIS